MFFINFETNHFTKHKLPRRLKREQPGESHPRAPKLHRWISGMFCNNVCHTKNVDTSVKNTFSMHAFISSMTPHLPTTAAVCARRRADEHLPFKCFKHRRKLKPLTLLSGLINRSACPNLMYLQCLLSVFCSLARPMLHIYYRKVAKSTVCAVLLI